jgi:hypothetical protein
MMNVIIAVLKIELWSANLRRGLPNKVTHSTLNFDNSKAAIAVNSPNPEILHPNPTSLDAAKCLPAGQCR